MAKRAFTAAIRAGLSPPCSCRRSSERRLQYRGERRVVGVDEEADAGDAGGHRLAQLGDARGGDMARARRMEDEAEKGGAAGDRGGDRGRLGQAADS